MPRFGQLVLSLLVDILIDGRLFAFAYPMLELCALQ